MLRFSGCALVVLSALTVTAYADKISFRPSGGFEMAVDLSDPSVQQAVITAAPRDWHDTPGADVWWVTLDGQRFQVQVFPALERPGAGEPNCCLHFTVDDTEFWLKVKAVSPQRPTGQQVVTDQHPSHSTGKNGHAPGARPDGVKPVSTWPGDAPLDLLLPDAALLPGLALPGAPSNSSSSGGGGSSEGEDLQSEGASTQSELVVAQVPEPGLLVLMGLGAAAALRRGRTRGRTLR